MIPKKLHFDDAGRQKLLEGVKLLAKAVKSTLGGMANTVIIESDQFTKGLTITKDGVTVAKEFTLVDPVHDIAARIVKEAAENTNDAAGDGTTTAIVLAEALFEKGVDVISEANEVSDNKVNVTRLSREINDIVDGVIKSLSSKSKPVSGSRLFNVANISANGDSELASIVAEAYEKVGTQGMVFYDHSKTEETYYDHTIGIDIERGYTNARFINNQATDECIFNDAYVLTTDQEIGSLRDLESIFEIVIKENKKLLLIANCSQSVTNALAANVAKYGYQFCQIVPPDFGYRSKELMSDISLAVGSTYFSEDSGDDLSLIQFSDLGRAKKVVVSKNKTSIVGYDDDDFAEIINNRVEELKVQKRNANNLPAKKFIDKRIACLTGGIAVIYVGGDSTVEQKERYDRCEDAVRSVKAAVEEGILPGGGIALMRESYRIYEKAGNYDNLSLAERIVCGALLEPFAMILHNGGIDWLQIDLSDTSYSTGIDVTTGDVVNMYRKGIIDPAKVTKTALRNATSVVTTLLNTNAILTLERA